MTARQLRRAQEHKDRKMAHKRALAAAASNQATVAELAPQPAPESQSRPNPRFQPVTSPITGRTTVMPAEEAAAYQCHLASYRAELNPVGPRESTLVQAIADADWRLNRIPALEMAIYARGHIQVGESFQELDAQRRAAVIEIETYFAYEKQLRDLHLQESRLHRLRKEYTAELQKLQAARQPHAQDPDAQSAAGAVESRSPRTNLVAGAQQPPFPEPGTLLHETLPGFEFSNRISGSPQVPPKN